MNQASGRGRVEGALELDGVRARAVTDLDVPVADGVGVRADLLDVGEGSSFPLASVTLWPEELAVDASGGADNEAIIALEDERRDVVTQRIGCLALELAAKVLDDIFRAREGVVSYDSSGGCSSGEYSARSNACKISSASAGF